eukprot:764161-Hanusia_phi.AAC.2
MPAMRWVQVGILLLCWEVRSQGGDCSAYLDEWTGKTFGLCEYSMRVQQSEAGAVLSFTVIADLLGSKGTIEQAEVHCKLEILANSSVAPHLHGEWMLSYQRGSGTILQEVQMALYDDNLWKKGHFVSDVHIGYGKVLQRWLEDMRDGTEQATPSPTLILTPVDKSPSVFVKEESAARCTLGLLTKDVAAEEEAKDREKVSNTYTGIMYLVLTSAGADCTRRDSSRCEHIGLYPLRPCKVARQ